MLEVYGLSQVKVLAHGYDDWLNKDYPVSLNESEAAMPSQYIASINHKRLASKFTTQLTTHNTNQLVIDAHKLRLYRDTSSAKRFGHIPTALSIPAEHNFSITEGFASLKTGNQLTEIYSKVPKNKKIVIYCAIGRVSSVNYLALRELGYDVSNYDASWNEWGNDLKLPIEK